MKRRPHIILASASLRRAEILKKLGIPFSVKPQNIAEEVRSHDAESEAVRISRDKVNAYLEACGTGEWVLGADTLLARDGRVIGKPRDADEARNILGRLSGRTHLVVTGLSLFSPERGATTVASATTKVVFARLSTEEIEWYLSTGDWTDAAGGYKIQNFGEILVEKIDGSYSNVVGLPIRTFYGILIANGYPVR